MADEPTVHVALGRCSNNGNLFGIRIKEIEPKRWIFEWSFAMTEATADRQGYDKIKLSVLRGTFEAGETFPGCPHCSQTGLVLCGACGNVQCWDGQEGPAVCPWCNDGAGVSDKVAKELRIGMDR